MKAINTFHLVIVAIVGTAFTHSSLADCAGASVKEVKQAYSEAQTLESQGKKEAALAAYVHAQEYTCEKNPVEADAAKRAAALSLPLAAAAEQRGDFDQAFRMYEFGGHFAKADAALIAHVRAVLDEPRAFESARSHFENRALESFQSNNAVRLQITGAYRVNAKLVAELQTLPAKGVARALKRDAESFNEQYLNDFVQLIQSQPDSPTDFAAMQSAATAQQAFAQRWPDDLLKRSREALRTLREWSVVIRNAELAASIEKSFAQRIEQHVAALTQRFSGAPKLLDEAQDYVHLLALDPAQTEPRIAKIRTQAMKQGDAASAKQRYALAADYYRVGGDDAKAQAARDRLQQTALAKMQPSIDEMQRQAALIQAQYSDPERIKAMQAQAEAMRKSLEAQQRGAKQTNAKRASELESELGL
jgi:hypothetical protein